MTSRNHNSLTPTTDSWDWQLQGSCRREDPELFFHPDGERGPARARRIAAAKAVCNLCPVKLACLEHAINVQEIYGIWGGMAEEERRRMQGNQRIRTQTGVDAG